MEYKRSAHVEEEEEEEEEEEDYEEEEEEEEERGRHHHHHHHYATAPAQAPAQAPAPPAAAHQHQHLHAAHQVLGSSAAPTPISLADIAAFSRPLLPPNSSLVSSPPPGFLSPHPHPLQQHAHRRRAEKERERTVEAPPPLREPERQQQQQQHHRHQEPARNGVSGGGTMPTPPAPTPALVTGGAAGPAAPEALPWRYRECLRNHAARMGAHVLDGCGEFMPSPGDGNAALLCAACGCHRSFHRREPVAVASPSPSPASAVVSPASAATPAGANSRLMPLLLAPPHMQKPRPPVQASPMSAPAALAESSSEELRPPPPPPPSPHPSHAQVAVGSASAPPAPGKKRFRTKFTPEQKERMMDFAHRVGWRIQKPDSDAVDAFCSQVGVPRRVLKVWMHNNKHLAKTPAPPSQPLHDDPPPPHHHHHHHPHPAQHNHHHHQQQQKQQHDP